ncbi:disulfide oxidoreductase [Tenuibacillus multivorans]|uniref:Probable disulfide formation protein n=1 Tax=Tenuibacillus multivorans TaxID=237069 RepID=A0A1H0B6U1_9BACI|nr:disulfide oxidoreductase [Tenuibacillus multivorans]GEL78621.1 putative disulfide formation protein C [Tenuibacillus multivorans]SDN41331.1 disulfide bond formation protein DsbB [Tenuibacillus multivorans]
MDKKNENLMLFAWIVAFVATLGSLYFSEIKLYEPCKLCWIQRIFMYPMVIILLIGIAIKDPKTVYHTTVFSIIGFLISSYHYLIQRIEALAEASPACGRVSCTGAYIDRFGFISIPFLAGTAFLIILITSIIVWKRMKEE